MRDPGFETLCAHAGEEPARHLGAVTPPIFQSSLFVSPDCETFIHRGADGSPVYDYTRNANPTTDILQTKIAALEHADAARCFGSGNAAVAASIMHAAKAGDHVVAVDTCYGPTRSLLTSYLPPFGIECTFVPGDNPQQFADAARANTKLFYLESPSSVVFKLQDLRAVAQIARERGVTTVADNSWASPYFQNPLDCGIDLVLHSATKYLGGHSDIVAGVVAGENRYMDSISTNEGAQLGGILDPFASWLMIRGLRTLALRMERHQQSGLAVAKFLEANPKVAVVHYPGLESHPQHDLAKRQMQGSSGLLSFELKDGTQDDAFAFVNALHYFGIGVSWGGFESLAIPIGFRKQAPVHYPGVTQKPTDEIRWGARLHIGLETVNDLLEDLSRALN